MNLLNLTEAPNTTEAPQAPTASPHNREVVRLLELMHRFEVSERKDIALRNLVTHITRHFPDELLPIMDRLSRWDESGKARVFYAKSAFRKGHLKLVKKVVEPLLSESNPDDSILLLGARTYARLDDPEGARRLLDRIPAGSKLHKGIGEVEAKISTIAAQSGSAPEPTEE